MRVSGTDLSARPQARKHTNTSRHPHISVHDSSKNMEVSPPFSTTSQGRQSRLRCSLGRLAHNTPHTPLSAPGKDTLPARLRAHAAQRIRKALGHAAVSPLAVRPAERQTRGAEEGAAGLPEGAARSSAKQRHRAAAPGGKAARRRGRRVARRAGHDRGPPGVPLNSARPAAAILYAAAATHTIVDRDLTGAARGLR